MKTNCQVPSRTNAQNRRLLNQRPAMNTIHAQDHVQLELSLPGWSKDEISINVEDQILIISGEHAEEDNPDVKYLKHTVQKKSFERKLKVDSSFDLSTIDAQMDQGILKLAIQKTKRSIKKITIK